MPPDKDNNGTKAEVGWRKWTNHVLFALLLFLANGIVIGYIHFDGRTRDLQFALISESINSLQKSTDVNDRNQLAIISKLVDKVDNLCSRVARNEDRLKLDYPSRMRLYKMDSFEKQWGVNKE